MTQNNLHVVECAQEICRDNSTLVSIFGVKSQKPQWVETVYVILNDSGVYVGWYAFNSRQGGDIFAVIIYGQDVEVSEIMWEMEQLTKAGALLPRILELRKDSEVPWPVFLTECTLKKNVNINFANTTTRKFIVESKDIREVENALVNYERWFTKD